MTFALRHGAFAILLLAGCRDFSGATSLFGVDLLSSSSDLAADLASADLPAQGSCAALSPAPRFCADFDEGSLGTAWSAVRVDPSVMVTLDDTVALTPPGSARMQLVAATPNCSYGRLEKEFVGEKANQLSLEFELRPASPWNVSRLLAEIFLEDPGGGPMCGLFFGLNGNSSGVVGAFVQVQLVGVSDRPVTLPPTFVPLADEWTKLKFEIISGATGQPQLTVSTRGQVAFIDTLSECKLGGHPSMAVGYHCENGGPADVHYDDVRFDFK